MAKTAYERLEEARHNGDGQAMRDLLQDEDVSANKMILARFLMKSIEDGEMEKFEALLDAGPDLTWSVGNAHGILNVAVLYNEPEMIRYLASAGADIHVLDQSENGLLHQAAYHCKSGETEVCQALVDVGCYADQVNRKGQSALHVASEFGRVGPCEFLAAAGASIDLQDFFGNAPLHYAATHGHVDACKLLIEAGADMDLVNDEDQTPRDVATGIAATYLQSVAEERSLEANTAEAKARYVEDDWTPSDNWASSELQDKINTAEQEHMPKVRPRAMRLSTCPEMRGLTKIQTLTN